jgi:cytochrome c oxidase subunit 3
MSEALLHEPWPDVKRQEASYTFGMWVFLGSEILFFGALFFVYAVNRGLHPGEVAAAASHTNPVYGTANTAILLASSCAAACAERAVDAQLKRAAQILLVIAFALGAAFLVVKGFEYAEDISKHLLPYGPAGEGQAGQMFWAFYWMATLVHAFHLVIGLIVFIRLMTFGAHGTLGPHIASVRLGVLYWHFVDIVWVGLFAMLYLVGRP